MQTLKRGIDRTAQEPRAGQVRVQEQVLGLQVSVSHLPLLSHDELLKESSESAAFRGRDHALVAVLDPGQDLLEKSPCLRTASEAERSVSLSSWLLYVYVYNMSVCRTAFHASLSITMPLRGVLV